MISSNHKKPEDPSPIDYKINTPFPSVPYSVQLSRSHLDQDLQNQDRKKSEKNKFINKLKQFQISSNSEMKTLPYTYPLSSGTSQAQGDRKEKNKIAARESRDRKKLYIKLMETKIERLESELEQTARSIQEVRLDIFSAEMRQGPQGKEANHRQIHIIKKIQGLLEDQDLDDRNNQINICLDSMIYRIGALGKERKSALRKLYFDLLNFSQPALYRYILWSAAQQRHLFGEFLPTEDEKWCREIEDIVKQVANNSDESRKETLRQIGEKIANHLHHFQKSAEDLVKFRAKIERKGQNLDEVFSEIREVLTPEQVARLILFVQKYQFKKEVRLFEDDNLEQMSRPIKKIKEK